MEALKSTAMGSCCTNLEIFGVRYLMSHVNQVKLQLDSMDFMVKDGIVNTLI